MEDLNEQTNVNGTMSNRELEDLGTHETGAVDLHLTRHTKKPVIIEPADAPGEVADEKNRK